MEQLKLYLRIFKEHKKIFQITAMIAIVIIAVLVFGQYGEKDEFSEQFTEDNGLTAEEDGASGGEMDKGENQADSAGSAMIYVDIGGEVRNPGVYTVVEGTRLFEVIKAAGGLTDKAFTEQINQAEVVIDGQKVVIPSFEDNNGTAAFGSSGNIGGTGEPAALGKDSQGRININLADSSVLQEIPGVGPATAEKIIAYREEKGKFSKIEDIKMVSGIGNKTFQKMKDKITV
jgi:competence protein ComEA